jgi:hypothetical protein
LRRLVVSSALSMPTLRICAILSAQMKSPLTALVPNVRGSRGNRGRLCKSGLTVLADPVRSCSEVSCVAASFGCSAAAANLAKMRQQYWLTQVGWRSLQQQK